VSKFDLSIVLPGIRHHNWKILYDSAVAAIGEYSFEMIIVGPGEIPAELKEVDNFSFYQDYGAPARAAQIGVSHATGRYITWASDDGVFIGNSLSEAVTVLEEASTPKCGVVMRYSEGNNFPDNSYWTAWTHADLRLPGVPKDYQIAPVAMYDLAYFKELGGWDCRYEHLNMCNHDLAFRFQNDGGYFSLSPSEVLRCTWDIHSAEWAPVGRAYRENDLPLWNSMYSQDQSSRIKIDFENWKVSPKVWEKRFGEEHVQN